jgi:hypothetical protein
MSLTVTVGELSAVEKRTGQILESGLLIFNPRVPEQAE